MESKGREGGRTKRKREYRACSGSFRLLFPTSLTRPCLKYFEEPVYSNLLLQKWQIEQVMAHSDFFSCLFYLTYIAYIRTMTFVLIPVADCRNTIDSVVVKVVLIRVSCVLECSISVEVRKYFP